MKALKITLLIAVASLSLAACSVVGGSDNPNPLPTVRAGESVGSEVGNAAGSSAEETWERYLRDSIAYQNDRQDIRLDLIQAYQNPDHVSQNAGGLMTDLELVEDRTTFDLSNNSTFAQSYVDYDVRLTFVDGDTNTLTCNYNVQIERDADDERWYVINPTGLDVYSVCG